MGSVQKAQDSPLFQPLQVGSFNLEHRIALAPLTRFRADKNHVPLPFVKEYYSQRASVPGTLLITEATFIAPLAGGYDSVPGIYNQSQINAWKEVTDAVHVKGSKIFVQLWALGRAASAEQLRGEFGPEGVVKSASNIPFDGGDKPTPLTEEEIKSYIGWYAQAAKNAVEAGFDGVEIHGANGYLLDQFTQDVSNDRTDAYGGSIENRARFPLAVAKAVTEAVGAEKVGYRVSPFSPFQGMKMEEPTAQFEYLVGGLKKLDLAYLHIVESRIDGNAGSDEVHQDINFLVDLWGKDGKAVLVAGGFTAETALEAVEKTYAGRNVVIVFGRYFISNPDLVFRVKEGVELLKYDRDLFYNKGEKRGYTDYAFSKEFLAANKA